jgi:hypothetical protein
MRAPILVMSFNRAQFLAPVLASLKAQSSDGTCGREIHLFQDGAVNRYSRLRYAKDEDIAASIALFRREFPEGVVHDSHDNIGICENFRRAEEYAFVDREFPCAWFFEDDLVLSPAYFSMMEQLQNFAENVGSVAYFAAYGNHYAQADEVKEHRREVVTLDHHWGFGLLAHHWRAMQEELRGFYDIVVGSDYSRRDHRKIFSLYERGRGCPRASSQDAAKAFACSELGIWRCNTTIPFGQYIGATGQHMTPDYFKELGFGNAAVSDTPVRNLEFPGPSGIRERVMEQRALFAQVRQRELSSIFKSLPGATFNPMRHCTRADVTAAYFLLLRRAVESESIFDWHVNKSVVHRFVTSILESKEFEELIERSASQFTFRDSTSRQASSAQDIFYIYALLCHREPDDIALVKHQGRTAIDLLVQGVLRSSEWSRLRDQLKQ